MGTAKNADCLLKADIWILYFEALTFFVEGRSDHIWIYLIRKLHFFKTQDKIANSRHNRKVQISHSA